MFVSQLSPHSFCLSLLKGIRVFQNMILVSVVAGWDVNILLRCACYSVFDSIAVVVDCVGSTTVIQFCFVSTFALGIIVLNWRQGNLNVCFVPRWPMRLTGRLKSTNEQTAKPGIGQNTAPFRLLRPLNCHGFCLSRFCPRSPLFSAPLALVLFKVIVCPEQGSRWLFCTGRTVLPSVAFVVCWALNVRQLFLRF